MEPPARYHCQEGRSMSAVDATLAAIDNAVGDQTHDGTCQKCGKQLGQAAPSADFCSEACGTAWRNAQADDDPADRGHTPDQELPERAPERPLSWLAPTPRELRAGHEILDEVTAFLNRFVVFPNEHCAHAVALWFAHTHIADRFYITPRLILDSAEPGSGKTRVLEVASLLVRSPESTISTTPAALFRLVSASRITILFDEVDAVFNAKGGNEDLRGLLNAGYKQGATVTRCAGDAKSMKIERFPVFAPVALGGIAGNMPATITTRAVTIHMRRRRSNQTVEQFRQRTAERDARPIREALAAWMASVADEAAEAVPSLPNGVVDRSAEIWEPLVAIADAAGGDWPERARQACAHFVLKSSQPMTTGIRLLADIRAIFERHATDRLATKELLAELTELEDAPWGDLDGRGKQLDGRRLATELARHGIAPVAFKDDSNTTVKGYVTYPTNETKSQKAQVGLADAWDRNLSAATPGTDTEGDAPA
ncbi:MAG: DUF3631 domain-containing protein [Actinophytocola sp.]|uniref:DUF3631 domain-containing protein n=1 Tax=Actinophytocola sp. TaxID=1872138 RepID=UPI003C7733C6